MRTCQVHNVRFYKPKPNFATCMALDKTSRFLALSRADATIEIWNLVHAPFLERIIHSTPDNDTIEGVAWFDKRLFSVGLHGFLVEYDLFTLLKKQLLPVTGEAVYCLDINYNTSMIAVGTEQGYLNIFNIVDDEVLFEKFLDKQEGRILCLKYDQSGNFIASGSIDTIRIWNVTTGNAIHRMTTGRSCANIPTVVWCLVVTEDLTVISGDSQGKLIFWDGKVGSQIEAHKSHRADILSIVLSSDEKSIYCSGVDPTIVNYVKINVKGESHKWVKSIQRKVHDHDVKCLALCFDKLYSSGVDGYLACSYHPPKTLLKYPPLLQNSCVTIGQSARYILLRYLDHIELWSFGEVKRGHKTCKDLLPLDKEPNKLLVLERKVKDDNGDLKNESVVCCSISSDGNFIAYSTVSVTRLFNFSYEDNNKPELACIDLPAECGPSLHVAFSGLNLILVPRSGGIIVLDLMKSNVSIQQFIKTNTVVKDVIIHFIISDCGTFLVAADVQSNIGVWKYTKKWEYYCKLPKYESVPTVVVVQPKILNLFVTYSDHMLVEYNLKKMALTKFSKSFDSDTVECFHKSFPIRNITFDPKCNSVVILHDDSNIVVVQKDNTNCPEPAAKVPKVTDDSLKPRKHTFHVIKKYKHLVHLGWLSDDEMVAVEVSPLSLLDSLPPCMKQDTFGTK